MMVLRPKHENMAVDQIREDLVFFLIGQRLLTKRAFQLDSHFPLSDRDRIPVPYDRHDRWIRCGNAARKQSHEDGSCKGQDHA